LKIERGRFFNENRFGASRAVVLLGYDTTRILFPESQENSLGKEVTIDGQLFTVIGTLQKQRQGISGGSNPEDNSAYMPVTTLSQTLSQSEGLCNFRQGPLSHKVGEAVEEIRDLLRRKRRLGEAASRMDFALFTSDYFLELWNKISGMIFILMFAVAFRGLMSAGSE